MAFYYGGNLLEDMKKIKNLPETQTLDELGKRLGYGRCQQILQLLWAKALVEHRLPASGALRPEPLETAEQEKDRSQ